MVTRLFKKSSVQTIAEAKYFLRRVELKEILAEIRHLDSSTILKQSTHHPNGFTKIILSKNNKGSYLRLHIWDNKSKKPDIHNHTSPFVSKVLSGGIKETRYKFKTVKQLKGNLTVYSHPSDPRVKRVRSPISTALLVSKSVKTIRKGEVYSIAMKTPHSTRVLKNTISLAIQLPIIASYTQIFSKQELSIGKLKKLSKLSKKQLKILLAKSQ